MCKMAHDVSLTHTIVLLGETGGFIHVFNWSIYKMLLTRTINLWFMVHHAVTTSEATQANALRHCGY